MKKLKWSGIKPASFWVQIICHFGLHLCVNSEANIPVQLLLGIRTACYALCPAGVNVSEVDHFKWHFLDSYGKYHDLIPRFCPKFRWKQLLTEV